MLKILGKEAPFFYICFGFLKPSCYCFCLVHFSLCVFLLFACFQVAIGCARRKWTMGRPARQRRRWQKAKSHQMQRLGFQILKP
ncbi:hypothetical protein V6Z12_D10G254600 [Gossypium hirsutum]